MLNCLCRPVASSACARLLRWATPLACAWLLAAPMAQAAETMAMPMEKGMVSATPFGTYQNWRDEPLQDWAESNRRVGEIGGWRTYLRAAQSDAGGADSSSQGRHGHHGK